MQKTKHKTTKAVVILFGLCAVLWSIRAVLEVIHKTYADSVFWFCLNVFCAILWIVCFFVNLKRYRSEKDE